MESIDYAGLGKLIRWKAADTVHLDDPKLEAFLLFTDKASYLAWRAEWRDAYSTLSKRIREERTAWRAEGSDHEDRLHHALFSDRAMARTMLALRAASKVKAGMQYRAEKEATAVA